MAKVCIIGFGCVGSGTYEVLKQNKQLIKMRTGETVDVKYIVDIRDLSGHEVGPIVTTNFDDVLSDEEVSIVIETMGGTTIAYNYTKAALASGKSVVTSNKELVASKGDELFSLAKENGVNYFYEASVGGGIPIIRPMISSLGANNITEITGILNGTTNYILTKMLKNGESFDECLKEAQRLGYAENDPTADVEGLDTGKKISILSSMVLGKKVNYEHVYTKGISGVTTEDAGYAEALGCAIKLIGKFRDTEEGPEVFVAPMLVNSECPVYNTDDVFNSILVYGDMLGETLFYGRGAGKLATASAVVSDVMEIVKNAPDHISLPWVACRDNIIKDYAKIKARFFVRIKEKPGSMERVISALNGERTLEIYDGEFAVVTSCTTEEELLKALSTEEILSIYMFV